MQQFDWLYPNKVSIYVDVPSVTPVSTRINAELGVASWNQVAYRADMFAVADKKNAI